MALNQSHDGLLLVDKPSEWTSHDVVAKIRNHFRIKKVGHGGTLDPMATGLLVILVGKGTKLSQRIMGSDKVYEGTMTLGVSTDSQDADGEVISEHPTDGITEEQVLECMAKMTGDIMQMPPMYSAIKKDGVPLYKLARKGKTIEREPRLIHIYSFNASSFNLPTVDFKLRCTKGTYVRTICSDIGTQLGCGAHLSRLRRTESGPLKIEKAVELDTLLKMDAQELSDQVISVSDLAMDYM